MADVIIRGGTVVDGTGETDAFRADVVIEDGRVTAVEEGAAADGATEIDADGLVVAPGFVDIHTHYDAQVFWDPTLSPSPLHGVTSVVGGNCGFSIAPLEAEHGDYLMRMLARVEGMPLDSLEQGVPWDWTSFGDYLDRLDGRLSINAGFMVGHSPLRRLVMGEDATQRAATEDEVARMGALLGESLAAGGMGFSSSWARTHNDGAGDPVPSRHATAEEIVDLCRVVGEHEGTTLEFIPMVGPFEDWAKDLMTDMSLAANRPLNWNILVVLAGLDELTEGQLSAGSHAAERGARVIALTIPHGISPRLSFASGFLLDTIPGWEKPMTLPHAEKMDLLARADGRAQLLERAREGGAIGGLANWGQYVLTEVFAAENSAYEGRSVAEVATEQGKEPFDALLDIVVADDLRTGFSFPPSGESKEDYQARVKVWRDDRAIIGASDAGAHLDFLATFNYATALLGNAVRDYGVIPLEEAVYRISGEQADLYGLRDRGRLVAGAHADIVVFDPETVGPEPIVSREDLPGGGWRLYGGATGIERVLVAGQEVVRGGELTDARPGTVLRSGRDTATVTVPGG